MFSFGHDILTFHVIEMYVLHVCAPNNKHLWMHTRACNIRGLSRVSSFPTISSHFPAFSLPFFNMHNYVELRECGLICVTTMNVSTLMMIIAWNIHLTVVWGMQMKRISGYLRLCKFNLRKQIIRLICKSRIEFYFENWQLLVDIHYTHSHKLRM